MNGDQVWYTTYRLCYGGDRPIWVDGVWHIMSKSKLRIINWFGQSQRLWETTLIQTEFE